MMPNMNAAQMAKMMQQMGIKTVQVDAARVIIEKKDGSKTVIEPASVTAIEMQGKQNFQVSGTVHEHAGTGEGSSEMQEDADAKIVAEQAKVPLEKAKAALAEANGDIAEAILKLQEGV